MRRLTATLLSLTMSAVATTSLANTSAAGTDLPSAPGVRIAQAGPAQPVAGASQASGGEQRNQAERDSFNVARFIDTCAAYELFLNDYPDGAFADQAARLVAEKCQPEQPREAPLQPAAVQSEPVQPPATAPQRQVVPDAGSGKATSVRRKQPKRVRKKPRRVEKKRVVKRKPPVRRSRVKRCRLETNWECIRRGGQMEFGACSRQRICE